MDRGEMAAKNFREGYNCAQSLVLAFADILPIDTPTLLRFASPFGGGMGRLREACGAVTGMFMVLGLLNGYEAPAEDEKKAELYRNVQDVALAFQREHGSLICRDLLGLPEGPDAPQPEKRTDAYYARRPCEELVRDAARILDAQIQSLRM
ncbi:MAG: C-GCAxxG-C-C family protein [Christensenellales bacterium]|jgi:C_GCAxxG_C_C family probable redox protein